MAARDISADDENFMSLDVIRNNRTLRLGAFDHRQGQPFRKWHLAVGKANAARQARRGEQWFQAQRLLPTVPRVTRNVRVWRFRNGLRSKEVVDKHGHGQHFLAFHAMS